MINDALQFITSELNTFINNNVRQENGIQPPLVVTDHISRYTNTSQGHSSDQSQGAIVISLVNLEEDHFSKTGTIGLTQANRENTGSPFNNTNLYCLVAVVTGPYNRGLEYLSLIVQFFYDRPVFDPTNSHMDETMGLDKISVDRVNLNMEQNQQLWQMLGTNYRPSVLYRLKLKTDHITSGNIHKTGRTISIHQP